MKIRSKKLRYCAFVLLAYLLICLIEYFVSAEPRIIYTKPAYQGRMIDNETKEPIEGVVVAAVYWESYSFCLGPAGCSPSIAGVAEALTDKKGEFHIKPFITWMGPFGEIGSVDFIIYKPGYASYPDNMDKHILKPLKGLNPEDFFSKELGVKGTITYPPWSGYSKYDQTTIIETTFGIVEMPKLKSREARLMALPSHPMDCRAPELPLLYKAINEERKKFGMGDLN